jgi:hypothetical protein
LALGWLQTKILLISASLVARIIGVSHWHFAFLKYLNKFIVANLRFFSGNYIISVISAYLSFGQDLIII